MKIIDFIASGIIYFPLFLIMKYILKVDMSIAFIGGLSYCIYFAIFERYMMSNLRKKLTKKE